MDCCSYVTVLRNTIIMLHEMTVPPGANILEYYNKADYNKTPGINPRKNKPVFSCWSDIMTLSKAKSIFIIILAMLTVYQTGVLWFVNITNRSFIPTYLPFFTNPELPDGLDRLVAPWRIVTVHGDGRFSVQYNDLTYSESKRYGDIVLSQLLQGGTFISASPADMDYLLSQPAYIYEYAFFMDAEWFTQGFGHHTNMLTAPGLRPFRQVIIRPPCKDEYEEPDTARIFFLCQSGYVYEYTVSPRGVDGPDSFIHTIPSEACGFYYTFANGQFIRYGEFSFYGVYVRNPFADIWGLMSLDFVMERVGMFFSNPAAIRSLVDDEVWIYRDVSTVVSYYHAHILEYISYRPIDRRTDSSFTNDFSAAVQFLERDNLIVNETFLADYRIEDNRRIFYFGYSIGNTPLIMPPNWPRGFNLPHPIIVEVEHGAVVQHRRLAFTFELDESNRLTAAADVLPRDYQEMILGYRINDIYMNNLYYFVRGDNNWTNFHGQR